MTEHPAAVALASQSPRRLQLLRALGLEVTPVASSYDERASMPACADAREIALSHATGKARCAHGGGPSLLVAADTIVVIDGQVLGKPRDPSEARAMLRTLAGREHVVHTGFIVIDRATDKSVAGVESTHVQFLPLAEAVIERYVASGEPMDKAGAYGVQERGALLIASVRGDFYTVMGLPLARIGQACAALGHELI